MLQEQTDPKSFEPKRLVVDGQQRLRTLLAYVDSKSLAELEESDDFKILKVHNTALAGKSFRELDTATQQRILQFEFSVYVLPPATPNRLLLEIFARMNSTGTKLNDQELRNAEFSGAFKQLCYSLSYQELDRWLSWRVVTKVNVARMVNVELISELLLFLFQGITAKSQKNISKAYRDFDDSVPQEKQLLHRYESIMEFLDSVFRTDTDGKGIADSAFATQGWLYVLFAFVHELGYEHSLAQRPSEKAKFPQPDRVWRHIQRRAAILDEGDLDVDLLKAIRGAATDKVSRTTRYDFIKKGFRE
jgi:hypothetical protein